MAFSAKYTDDAEYSNFLTKGIKSAFQTKLTKIFKEVASEAVEKAVKETVEQLEIVLSKEQNRMTGMDKIKVDFALSLSFEEPKDD